MFARFDENPAMTLQDIKKKKTLRTHARTHAHTHGQRENSIPTTNKVCGGYKGGIIRNIDGLLDKKARTGIAMETVAEILDNWRSTDGRSLIITSCISKVHNRSDVTHSLAHFDTIPNCRHFTSSR